MQPKKTYKSLQDFIKQNPEWNKIIQPNCKIKPRHIVVYNKMAIQIQNDNTVKFGPVSLLEN